ncbi:MAG TPA: AraC family transcriptional regulator, partial [Puia sp.]|nr:AraC family transcriptional regulator [Puia sp.]
SDFFKMSESKQNIMDKSPRRNNILLSSTNYDMELTYSKNSVFRTVAVLFSPDFVRKFLKKDVLLDIMLYTGQRLENVNRVPITFEYRQLLDDIFSADLNLPISNLMIQNRILLLTEKFLNTFLEKRFTVNETGRKMKKEKEKDLKALKDVEEMLSNGTLDKFPSIDTLSRTAMMSSTKLKTKFKSVYGMKLYEFYNRNRLEKAKEMLQSGKYSVKEVGHDIGFSNLSNFAKAFKKEFGFLPNEMLRN